MSFAAEVWKALSEVDCSKHIAQKGGYDYLSWAYAWTHLMEVYPESTYLILDNVIMPDNSVQVIVSVTVTDADDSFTRSMRLPVMDHKNKSIVNPNARDISDSTMRCMVKCLALFGLGLFIYRGEDIPKPRPEARTEATDDQSAIIQDYLDADSTPDVTKEFIKSRLPLTESQAATIIKKLQENT